MVGAALLSSFAPCLQSADVQPEGAITIKPDELSVLSVTVLSGPPLVCDVRRDRLGSVPHTHTHTHVSDRMSCDFIDNLSRNRIL